MRSSLKILLILSALCVTLISTILSTTPSAQGFELSIYDAYPPIFWFSLILLYSCGIFVLIHNIIGESKISHTFLGLALICLYNWFIICLRTFRGYPFADTQDLNVHLAHLSQIVFTDHLGLTNIYPLIHIYGATLKIVSQFDYIFCANIITWTIYTMFLLGLYVFSLKISKGDTRIATMTLIFASIPIFGRGGIYFSPNALSVMLLPVILLLYEKGVGRLQGSVHIASSVALTVIFFAVVFFHPMTTLHLIFILLVLMVVKIMSHLNSPLRLHRINICNISLGRLIYFPLILATLFSLWYADFPFIKRNARGIFTYLTDGIGKSAFDAHTELVSQAGIGAPQLLELAINRYGDLLIYLIPLIIFIFMILLCGDIRSKVWNNKPLLTLLTLFLATVLFSVTLFFIQRAEESIIRVFRVPIIITAVINGFYLTILYNRISNPKLKQSVICIVTFFVIIAASLSTFNFYESPRTAEASTQVTNMELFSVNWSLNYIPKETDIKHTQIRAYYIQKRFILPNEWDEKELFDFKNFIPTHYGYTDYIPSIDMDNSRTSLMLTGKRDILFKYSFPEVSRKNLSRDYTEHDLILLNGDKNVVKLYDCGECNVWKGSIPRLL